MVLFEDTAHGHLRTLHLNRPPPSNPGEGTWLGDSPAHWEGDTLVVDTVGFNDRTWLNDQGAQHSDALHLVERIRPILSGLPLPRVAGAQSVESGLDRCGPSAAFQIWRIDAFAGPHGASHIAISSTDKGCQGDAALEMLYPESSHSLDEKVRTALENERVERGLVFKRRGFSHAVLFYTAGEIARRYLPGYEMYGVRNSMFVDGWPEILPVLEKRLEAVPRRAH